MQIIVVSLLLTLLAAVSALDETRESCKPGATPPKTRVVTAQRVTDLRASMRTAGVYALIIPTADDHQNEYVSKTDKKRAFISGFSGSAGTALVTEDDQLLWTDGRYFLQAADELDCEWQLMRSGERDVPSLLQWIADNVDPGKKIGADAKVISTRSWKAYEETFARKDLSIVDTGDLAGPVWENSEGGRPQPSNEAVETLDIKYAGRTWQQKIADLRRKLNETGADFVVVSALDEVAWLFNLRGTDIAYNPVFFAYAVVELEDTVDPKLYLRDAGSRTSSIHAHLEAKSDGTCEKSPCVQILDYSEVDDDLKYFNSGSRVNYTAWISDSTNYHITSLMQNTKRIIDIPSPLLLMKAIKNPVEREGMRQSHIRDSAAIIEFISKLEKELDEGIYWDELKVVDGIDSLRESKENNKGLSFGTIAGSGVNGAYIHYNPTAITNNTVNKTNMLLLDSGGQYLDGTTDITRTFHFGEPTDFQKLTYTLVLLGVIDLAMMKFPANKTLGSSLDTFARRPMWEYGLDFGHGTGHGLGMYLNVHEGPARIAARRASSSVSNERPVYDGMFFSDEPGYYDAKEGFGIRLETIVMATYVDTKYGSADTTLAFEPIALVPFEKKLIKMEMLDEKQREWLNDYHKLCQEKTGAALKAEGLTDAFNWLSARTDPVPLTDSSPSPTQAACDCSTTSKATSINSLFPVLLSAVIISVML